MTREIASCVLFNSRDNHDKVYVAVLWEDREWFRPYYTVVTHWGRRSSYHGSPHTLNGLAVHPEVFDSEAEGVDRLISIADGKVRKSGYTFNEDGVTPSATPMVRWNGLLSTTIEEDGTSVLKWSDVARSKGKQPPSKTDEPVIPAKRVRAIEW